MVKTNYSCSGHLDDVTWTILLLSLLFLLPIIFYTTSHLGAAKIVLIGQHSIDRGRKCSTPTFDASS